MPSSCDSPIPERDIDSTIPADDASTLLRWLGKDKHDVDSSKMKSPLFTLSASFDSVEMNESRPTTISPDCKQVSVPGTAVQRNFKQKIRLPLAQQKSPVSHHSSPCRTPVQERDCKEATSTETTISPGASKPKRPVSAYNLFFKKRHQELVKMDTHKKLTFSKIGKIIGNEWQNLCQSERVQYESRAKKDQLRYREEITVWKKEERKKNRRQNQQQRLSQFRNRETTTTAEDDNFGSDHSEINWFARAPSDQPEPPAVLNDFVPPKGKSKAVHDNNQKSPTFSSAFKPTSQKLKQHSSPSSVAVRKLPPSQHSPPDRRVANNCTNPYYEYESTFSPPPYSTSHVHSSGTVSLPTNYNRSGSQRWMYSEPSSWSPASSQPSTPPTSSTNTYDYYWPSSYPPSHQPIHSNDLYMDSVYPYRHYHHHDDTTAMPYGDRYYSSPAHQVRDWTGPPRQGAEAMDNNNYRYPPESFPGHDGAPY